MLYFHTMLIKYHVIESTEDVYIEIRQWVASKSAKKMEFLLSPFSAQKSYGGQLVAMHTTTVTAVIQM